MKINREILLQIPFIDLAPIDGRVVFLQPYFDKNDNTFKMYYQQEDKLKFIFAKPIECFYWAESLIDDTTDIFVPFFNIISNHYSFDLIQKTLIRIKYDVLNLSVVVEKYFIFLDLFKSKEEHSISSIIKTDLEYYFGIFRSLYDLIHWLFRDLWKISAKKTLPETFEKMINKKPEYLDKKYDLPDPLISYYMSTKDFFLDCREIRNHIYHGGLTPEFIVCFQDGFAFQKDSRFFPSQLISKFDIWPKEKIKQNNLVSILPLISFINKKILENLNVFSQALIRSIKPLDPISRDHKLFLRGPYVHHLIKIEEYMNKQWI